MIQDFEKRFYEDFSENVAFVGFSHNVTRGLIGSFVIKELKLQRAEVIKEISDKLNADCTRISKEFFETGRKDENLAWLRKERCFYCGKEKKPDKLTDICIECYEEQ